MRKILAIFFLSTYLLAATACNQLLKIPALITHFSEHKSQNRALDFLEFLKMHYLLPPQAHQDNDQDRDMQLPFKLPAPSVVALAIVPSNALNFLSIIALDLSSEIKKYPLLHNCGLPTSQGSSIWQPPRSV